MDNNPAMDKAIVDVETLRARLKGMTRAEARRIAIKAGLKCSTVEKFRGGHITEPGAFKVQALVAALSEPARKAQKARAE